MRIAIIYCLDWVDHANQGLAAAGFRSGAARRLVVDYLGAQDCCLSVAEIHAGIRAQGRRVGIASVYRVLDTLAELRLVQRVDFGDAVARFEPAHGDGHHHHHVVCGDCGRVDAFEDTMLEQALERVAGRLGYAMAEHEVVLRGACGDCRAA